jgi:hypothetical protein
MPRYAAPQRTPRHRRSLSRRTLIVFASGFLVPASLLAIARTPVNAAPSNNPIFATVQDVQNAINAALAPIQNAIADLQTQQANQATQISNLQSATSKSLKVYDANGQELGLLVNHNSRTGNLLFDMVYSPALNRFIYLYESSFGFANVFFGGFANIVTASYQSSDCTGTPYQVAPPSDFHNSDTDSILPFTPQIYYEFTDAEGPSTITTNSDGSWNAATNQFVCVSQTRTDVTAYQLHQVNLPFSAPIAQPLQFKYQ